MYFNSGTFKDPSEKLDHYLQSFGQESIGFLGLNKSIRYEEGILENDEEVAVCGDGSWRDLSELPNLEYLRKKGVSKIFVFKNTPSVSLTISDDLRIINT